MSSRYADRFRADPAPTGREVLDLGQVGREPVGAWTEQLTEDGPEPSSTWHWHDSWVARTVLVTALVAGASGGALGWAQWRSHQDDQLARQTVDLSTWTSGSSFSDDPELVVTTRFRNDGAYDLVVREPRFDSDLVELAAPAEELRVGAGASASLDLRLRVRCAGDADVELEPSTGLVAAPPLEVVVETTDGAASRQVLASRLSPDVLQWITFQCQVIDYPPTFAASYADYQAVLPPADGVVRAVIDFGMGPDLHPDVRISSVTSVGDAYAVTFAPGDIRSGSSDPGLPITVSFRVSDCAAALAATDADLAITITGAMVDEDTTGNLWVAPSADLAVELTRLTIERCPQS